jgi:hypothetical protein
LRSQVSIIQLKIILAAVRCTAAPEGALPPLGDLDFNLPAFTTNASKVFINVLSERKDISKYLRCQSGVYCWINLLNGGYYIGSAVDLGNRFNDRN